MIIVTGGAGFIGSAAIWRLNEIGRNDILIVDELGTEDKWKNLNGLKFADFIDKYDFMDKIKDDSFPFAVDTVIHLGACSSTTESDADYLMDNNFRYSQELVKYFLVRGARFIYASSAATYGTGELGYNDDEEKIEDLRPLNMYGYSKHLFDIWIKREKLINKVVGLKYFNVYGPNEYHKDDMRSVVHKAFEQIRDTGKVNLFKSYRDDYKDGEQKRDFVYVKDAVDMTLYFMDHPDKNGIFNIGTGQAKTWNDLVTSVFNAMDKPVKIDYVDMNDDLKNKYQYFTEANIDKIKNAGYDKAVTSLEDGVKDYVQNYLLKKEYFGMTK